MMGIEHARTIHIVYYLYIRYIRTTIELVHQFERMNASKFAT